MHTKLAKSLRADNGDRKIKNGIADFSILWDVNNDIVVSNAVHSSFPSSIN
uniref:Uncharacterized protein n=1 Tax=Nelumbo nucifera TaxID=4432 RepID=A0A822XYF0_NELNU|nr:TPA_asm: hypothetical protein HUJ06_023891 [Nelumbo nucifera]